MKKNDCHFFRAEAEYPDLIKLIKEKFVNDCSDFVEFQKNDIVQGIIKSNNNPQADQATMVNMMYFMTRFMESGSKMFSLNNDLCRSLCYTDLDMESDALNAYDGGMYFSIPHDLLSIVEGDAEKEIHGFYIVIEKFNDGDFKKVYNEYTPSELDILGQKIDDVYMQIRIMACGFPKDDQGTLDDDYFMYFRLPIFKGKLKPQMERYMDYHKKSKMINTAFKDGDKENIWKLPAMFNFIVNVLLYMNSDDADFKKEYTGELLKRLDTATTEKRKNNLRKKIKDAAEYTFVGGGITLTDAERKAFSSNKNWMISYEFIVRGHYRNQFYKSLGAHQRIWIRPYLKGEGKGDRNE